VSDEAEGIYRLMMSDYTLPVNIGNPEVGLEEGLRETIGYFRSILKVQ